MTTYTHLFPGLVVGGGDATILADNGAGGVKEGWFVISAAKDPWHREVLGYTGRGAPKDSPEYLLARRERRLICNLIDVDNPDFIREEIVSAVIEAIDDRLDAGDTVLLHCNQGQSRAPTLALLWLRWTRRAVPRSFLSQLTPDQAFDAMRQAYPPFSPSKGMELYARAHWESEWMPPK